MRVEVALGPGEWATAELDGRTAVVLDVLRATTTVTTALFNGAAAVVPFADLEECRAYKKIEPDVLLGGEREGVRPPGFDLGNSPLEYTPEKVAGRRIAYTTTNGTRALAACRGAEEVLLGALVNRRAVAERLAAGHRDATLVCAGKRGGSNLEDTYCAGAIIDSMESLAADGVDLSDRALIVLALFRAPDAGAVLERCEHGRALVGLGFSDDVAYCGRMDVVGTVGVLENGEIRAAR
ncbi:MAG TPA: 2-phosphosulfolactate phosphatase [bacterium]|nr:2-phosphosulfolactate phosphatase [bacterium]